MEKATKKARAWRVTARRDVPAPGENEGETSFFCTYCPSRNAQPRVNKKGPRKRGIRKAERRPEARKEKSYHRIRPIKGPRTKKKSTVPGAKSGTARSSAGGPADEKDLSQLVLDKLEGKVSKDRSGTPPAFQERSVEKKDGRKRKRMTGRDGPRRSSRKERRPKDKGSGGPRRCTTRGCCR